MSFTRTISSKHIIIHKNRIPRFLYQYTYLKHISIRKLIFLGTYGNCQKHSFVKRKKKKKLCTNNVFDRSLHRNISNNLHFHQQNTPTCYQKSHRIWSKKNVIDFHTFSYNQQSKKVGADWAGDTLGCRCRGAASRCRSPGRSRSILPVGMLAHLGVSGPLPPPEWWGPEPSKGYRDGQAYQMAGAGMSHSRASEKRCKNIVYGKNIFSIIYFFNQRITVVEWRVWVLHPIVKISIRNYRFLRLILMAKYSTYSGFIW